MGGEPGEILTRRPASIDAAANLSNFSE